MKNTDHMNNIFDPAMWVFIIYLIGFFLLFKFAGAVFGALVFGLYLALIIELPATYLNKLKFMPYKVSVVLCSILMFFLLAFAIYSIFPILIEEGQRLIPVIAASSQDINAQEFFENLDPEIVEYINSFISTIGQKFAEFGGTILNSVIKVVPDAMTSVIIFIITATYFTTLSPIFKANIWRFFPKSTRHKSIKFVKEYYRDIRHFIGGQVIIALIVGTMVGAGTFISGIPYSLFLGFLSGITNFIPFLGVFIASIPALLLGFVYGGFFGFIKMLIVLIIANQIESWVLSPRIQGSRMKLNWFAILLSILLAGTILGLAGVLLGIPLLLFIKKFWVEYIQESYNKL
ncbi:MAG TPA: AI-2E family transporter [Thermotogota bacterium]|nr:AI-2E family transporter [Thermotogota bacterium]HPJ87693.1 AI-2E family transporter [Thermotogota bacterium]HPR94868.1 AI-2E family transporter [Thermotogota bacterium]